MVVYFHRLGLSGLSANAFAIPLMGLAVPASNNASLQLAPDQVAAIAGLRGMFRQSGSIIAVSVTTHPVTDGAEVVGAVLALKQVTPEAEPTRARLPHTGLPGLVGLGRR